MSTAWSASVAAGANVRDDGMVRDHLNQLAADADNLRGLVNEYLESARDGIETFNPKLTTGLNHKSFERTYSGHEIDIPTERPTLNVDNAPDFDQAIGQVTFDNVSDPGDYTGWTYTPVFTDAPEIETIQAPEDWNGNTDVDIPTELNLAEIVDPSILNINVPHIPELVISDFTATAPDFGSVRDIHSNSFNFTEIQYTSDVLSDTDLLIQQMIAGGVGIPESIWNKIFERAGTQIDHAADQLINEISTDWASRGFSLPQGVEIRLVAEARQDVFDKKAEFARDNAIAYSQEEIKNLQFAVQQGIAFETLRGGWHEQEMQRALEVAKYIVESEIQLLQADIALINAKGQIFQIEAQVYKTLIDGEVAKMEKYKLDIQAQNLKNTVNDSQVKLYSARIQYLNTFIEEYNSKVKAASVEADVIKTQVQVYSEQIKAFVSRIQAESAKIDLYKNTVEAESVKMGAYETAVKVYTAEINAYSAKIGASKAKSEAEIGIEQLKLASYDSSIKGYAAEVGAKADAFKAEASMMGAYVRGSIAQAEDEHNRIKVLLESDRNMIAFDSELVKLQVADASASARAAEASAKITIDTNKSIAEINAGLAGSIYSAINVSASDSASVSGSYGESTRYNGGDI